MEAISFEVRMNSFRRKKQQATKRMKFVDKWHEQAFQTMDLNEDVLPKGSQSEGLVQDRFPYNMPFS